MSPRVRETVVVEVVGWAYVIIVYKPEARNDSDGRRQVLPEYAEKNEAANGRIRTRGSNWTCA
jgi:hypothetical protein